ncbi:MAG: redoxin domain-containing protein [Proteobacteria bacterium]|nr:redoxin domain-containing protein [Pseudomonadota bacterium]MCP4921536.1 redoxin domain-containing protein [Pseudomonadota bacterium]
MIALLSSLAFAAPAIGEPAPDFTLTDLDGNTVTLSEHADEVVVLEWFNPGCPFVVYAHGDDGPLQKAALNAVENDGVVWLAINSGAPGKQGHGVEKNKAAATDWAMQHPILIDEDGTVGQLYAATTTPQMVVVDHGVVTYYGALDNAPRGRVEGKGEYHGHLTTALAETKAGTPISVATTKPYGCSVKYE